MAFAGPVTFTDEHSLFARLQTVEMASLVASGAATLGQGFLTMANGANLAYLRKAFVAVNGYENTPGTPSGDDIFLLHKLQEQYPAGVRFLKHPAALVRTYTQPTATAFFQQRVRWASKWRAYSDWRISALAAFVFVSNATLLVGLGSTLVGKLPLPVFLSGISLRFLLEGLFLARVLCFLGKRKLILFIPLVQSVYAGYVVFFAGAAQGRSYQWKGRNLR